MAKCRRCSKIFDFKMIFCNINLRVFIAIILTFDNLKNATSELNSAPHFYVKSAQLLNVVQKLLEDETKNTLENHKNDAKALLKNGDLVLETDRSDESEKNFAHDYFWFKANDEFDREHVTTQPPQNQLEEHKLNDIRLYFIKNPEVLELIREPKVLDRLPQLNLESWLRRRTQRRAGRRKGFKSNSSGERKKRKSQKFKDAGSGDTQEIFTERFSGSMVNKKKNYWNEPKKGSISIGNQNWESNSDEKNNRDRSKTIRKKPQRDWDEPKTSWNLGKKNKIIKQYSEEVKTPKKSSLTNNEWNKPIRERIIASQSENTRLRDHYHSKKKHNFRSDLYGFGRTPVPMLKKVLYEEKYK